MTKKLLEKKVMLYPGKDSNYNYRAIPLRNTIIIGRLGSGVISLTNQIIIKLITEYPPCFIQLDYWDKTGLTEGLWLPKCNNQINTDRWVPHFRRIGSGNRLLLSDYLVDVERELEERKEILEGKTFEDFNKTSERKLYSHICIINDLYGKVTDKLLTLLKECEQVGIYFIISTQNLECVEPIVDLCSNRICCRCSTEVSERLLDGDDVAAVNMPKRGLCYYWNSESNEPPEKIYVPFVVDTWIMKLIGTYSVRRENLER